MPQQQRPTPKREGPLDQPIKFRVIIEGGFEAPDDETARAYCMASISFTAGFGQQISAVRVAIAPQQLPAPPLVDANGIRVPPSDRRQ